MPVLHLPYSCERLDSPYFEILQGNLKKKKKGSTEYVGNGTPVILLNKFGERSCNIMRESEKGNARNIDMDYLAKINQIESELVELKDEVKSATGEQEHVINQRVIALENKRGKLYDRLPLPADTAGNSQNEASNFNGECFE